MKLAYELSYLALKDIDNIWTYTATKWSVDQANKYYEQIFEAIDSICQEPRLGKSIKEIKDNHRSQIVKSHMIIYQIEKKKILIDRILHQGMDIESQITER